MAAEGGPTRYTTTGLGGSRAPYAEAYRQMALSFERRPGALGARWRGFSEGLSDQEGYALLMEYLRRQRAQKATGPQARTPPVANAGTTPMGAGFPSVVEASSSSSTTGPLVGSGVMGCQPTQRPQLTVGATWQILHALGSPRLGDEVPANRDLWQQQPLRKPSHTTLCRPTPKPLAH